MVGGGIKLARIVEQKDPAGLEAHQLHDRGQRIVERCLDVGGAIERFGDMVEDEKLAITL